MGAEKSVTFILPFVFTLPAGGPKVVYEYANRLAGDGWTVWIAYDYPYPAPLKEPVKFLKRFIARYFWKSSVSGRRWFPLSPKVREWFAKGLVCNQLPKTSLYVATAVGTSFAVNSLPVPASRKFYMVQGYEIWGKLSEKEVLATYHFDMNRLVVSSWLKKIMDGEGLPCTLIPNGFDTKSFNVRKPVAERDPDTVSMVYDRAFHKGCGDAMKALEIVKSRRPGLRVIMFGVRERPAEFPEWIEYHRNPSLQEHNSILNRSSVFINASLSEGWGLTVGEAMLCGNAVACTDIPGFREMVEDGKTGLMSPVKDPEALADNILRLMEDDALRINLAEAGNRNIQKFSWEDSYRILSDCFNSAL